MSINQEKESAYIWGFVTFTFTHSRMMEINRVRFGGEEVAVGWRWAGHRLKKKKKKLEIDRPDVKSSKSKKPQKLLFQRNSTPFSPGSSPPPLLLFLLFFLGS